MSFFISCRIGHGMYVAIWPASRVVCLLFVLDLAGHWGEARRREKLESVQLPPSLFLLKGAYWLFLFFCFSLANGLVDFLQK